MIREALAVGIVTALAAPATAQSVGISDRARHDPGTPPRPNLLLIVADDLGIDVLNCYSSPGTLPSTPVIDQLAAEGLRFTNVWSDPVCSPTRATLQTGRAGFRTGIGYLVNSTLSLAALAPSELTLPEMLDSGAGGAYLHATLGKWHLGNPTVGGDLAPNLAGYSHFSGTLNNFYAPSTYYNWPKVVDGVASTSTTYATTANVDDALQWIASVPSPWLCQISFNAPHSPFHAPPPSLHSVDLSNPNSRKFFLAMVEAMDTEIGRLLASLPPATRSNTYVAFVGDNGTSPSVTAAPFNPNHAKGTLYEGGLRVPLILHGPGVPVGVVQGLVQTTDLFATLGDLARVDWSLVPGGRPADSISLRPYLTDPGRASLRQYAYAEMFWPNGVGNPPTPPPCPGGTVCQTDLGYGGPGTAQLSLCGEELYGGTLDISEYAKLQVMNGPPNAVGTLYASNTSNPTSMFGGTVVPWPPTMIEPIQLDGQGSYTQKIQPNVLGGPTLVYYQVVLTDASQPQGYSITNALEVDFLWTDMQAIRDAQYKLIVNNPKCEEVFHDLLADPFEQVNLLSGSLTPDQAAHYTDLKATLAQWKL